MVNVPEKRTAGQGYDDDRIERLIHEVAEMGERIDRMETRLEEEARAFDMTATSAEPDDDGRAFGPDEPGHVNPPPRLARCDDGRVLLVLEDTEGRDLTGRKVIVCVELTAEEQERALDAWSQGAQNAAGALIGALPKVKR